MKKVLVMSALVAFSTAFVACSSDDDLVQQKPEVPEESVEKLPMTIFVSETSTRGTDFSISGTNPLTSFSMYSTIDASWQANVNSNRGAGFEKISGTWRNTTGADTTWPNESTDYTFYAVNDVENMTSAPTVTGASVSFGYAMPQSQDTNEDWYYDYTKQVDLLVAKETTNYNAGDPKGSINVHFQHALAQIRNIYVYCDYSKLYPEDADYLHLRVNAIKLGGLKAAGTYTFDATTPWVVSGDDAEYEIPLAIEADDEAAFNQMSFEPSTDKKGGLKLPLQTGDGGLYIIPQIASGEVIQNSSRGWDFDVSGAYADIHLQAASTAYGITYILCYQESTAEGNGWNYSRSKDNGFQWVRCPLKFDITAGSGKYYNLYIDLTKAVVIEKTLNANTDEGLQAIPSSSIEFDTN